MARNIDPIYKRYVASVAKSLSNTDFYDYFMKVIAAGKTDFNFSNRRVEKEVDEVWVAEIERVIKPMQEIINNPRNFIMQEEIIVNVALAKKTTPDSIRHLAQHGDMIDSVSEDSVRPNRLMEKFKEDTWNTYENKFVYTLLEMAWEFVDKRYEAIFAALNQEEGAFMQMSSSALSYQEKIDVNMDIRIQQSEDLLSSDEKNESIFSRIARLHRLLGNFRSSVFAKTMAKFGKIKPPLVRTNAIAKNPNFKACHRLWNFILAYHDIGYNVNIYEQSTELDDDFVADMYNSIMVNYIILKNHLEANVDRAIDTSKPFRKKALRPKFNKEIVEEFVKDYDLPDVEIRKVLVEEITMERLMQEEESVRLQMVQEKEKEMAERAHREKIEIRRREKEEERVRNLAEKERRREAARLEKQRQAELARQEKEKAKRELEEQKLAEALRAEMERVFATRDETAEKIKAEKLKRDAEAARLIAEREAAEKAAAEKAEAERIAAEKAEAERIAAEEAAAKAAAEKAEAERIAAEKAAAEKAEADRLAAEKAAAEKAEAERLAIENVKAAVAAATESEEESGEDGLGIGTRYRYTFMARLIRSQLPTQDFYTDIKNELLSYKRVKSRIRERYEQFSAGRTKCAKINVKGKTLFLYLPLDPKAYNANKYYQTDLSEEGKDVEYPFLLKVRSERGVKYAKELIGDVMALYGLPRLSDFIPEDYHMEDMTPEEMLKLDPPLVKVIGEGNGISVSFEKPETAMGTLHTVAEKPAEEPAPVFNPAPVAEETESEEESEGETSGIGNRYRYTFMARLIRSQLPTQDYYTDIKNALLSYKRVKSRVSERYETFSAGRTKCAKINVKGRTLFVYLPLDPKAYNVNKYYHIDLSEEGKEVEFPFLLKVRSDRAAKYARELVAEVMAKYGIEQLSDFVPADYHMADMTPEEMLKLDPPLVKLIAGTGTSSFAVSETLPTAAEEPAESETVFEPAPETAEPESVEEIAESEPVEEVAEPAEEIAEPVEEVAESFEEVAEPESAAEPAEEIATPAPVVSETNADGENGADTLDVGSRYRYSFMARLIRSQLPTQDYYTEIKNELLSYKRVKSRISERYESFSAGRVKCAKLNIKGKTICLYLPLDPKVYNVNKYFHNDLNEDGKNIDYPFMLKIRSDRGVKYAKELIAIVMSENGLVYDKNFVPADYHMADMTPEEMAKLNPPLVKIIEGESEYANKSGKPAKPAEKPAKPAEEIAEPVEEVAEPVEEIAEPVEEVAEPVEEVAEPAEEIAEPAEEVAEPVEEVAEPAEEIAEPVEEIAEPAEEIAEPVEEVAEPQDEKEDVVLELQDADESVEEESEEESEEDELTPDDAALLGLTEEEILRRRKLSRKRKKALQTRDRKLLEKIKKERQAQEKKAKEEAEALRLAEALAAKAAESKPVEEKKQRRGLFRRRGR